MAQSDNFTQDELRLLSITPSLIGASISAAESSGVIGTVKEAMANAKGVLSGVQDYPNNPIITAVIPNLEDKEEALAKAKEMRANTVSRLKDKGIASHEMLQAQVLEDCKAVTDILNQKATAEDAAEYKAWAMSIAERVAMAATEGGFLGFGGERLSAGEVTSINEIASALDTSPPGSMLA